MTTPRRVWITRTRPGADHTAARVSALAWHAVVEPLLEVRPIADAMLHAPLPDQIASLALTSPNTLVSVNDWGRFTHLPAYAVGDTTARAAEAAGFANVLSAQGDIHALATLIADKAPMGTVFAPGAVEPAGDLPALLPDRSVIRLPVYETLPTNSQIPHDIDAVLLHSPRAARILSERLTPDQARALTAITISTAAARPLNGLPFKEIRISHTPDEEGVLTALGKSPTPV